jgi:predicted permease
VTVYAHVLTAIIPLFALIFLGYVAKKIHLLHATDAPVLNRFVIFITLPAFIFHAILTNKLRPELIKLPFVFWVAELLMLGMAVAAGRFLKWPRPAIGTLAMQGTFGNTGYLGYPICTAVLPLRLPGAVIIDQFGMSIPLYPLAPIMGQMFGHGRAASASTASPFQFLKTPVVVALVIAILLKFIPSGWVPASPPLAEAGQLFMLLLTMIGNVTIPVVLIAIGILLRPSSLAMHGKKVAFVGIFKLLIMPIVVWLLAKYAFHISGSLLAVCVMEAAMPPSASSTVFAGQYDLDGGLAIASFFALTVVSAVTLPLMLGILR